MIDSFKGEYFFLSNFYPIEVQYDGLTYLSSEAAFQAAKAADIQDRIAFTVLTASEAKKRGRHIKLRHDWETVKYAVMYDVVFSKFSNNPDIRQKLINTSPKELVEGNSWGDTTWGKVNGVGENWLGIILTDIRFTAMMTKATSVPMKMLYNNTYLKELDLSAAFKLIPGADNDPMVLDIKNKLAEYILDNNITPETMAKFIDKLHEENK